MKIPYIKKSARRVLAKTFSFLLVCLVVGGASCTQTEPVDSEGNPKNCFSKSSLEEIPWVKKQLRSFQHPKSGPITVGVSLYKEKYFIVFANPSVSCPGCYIFDCSGTDIAKLNIVDQDFFDNSKLVEILFTGNY